MFAISSPFLRNERKNTPMQSINSLRPNDAYMRRWTKSSLSVQMTGRYRNNVHVQVFILAFKAIRALGNSNRIAMGSPFWYRISWQLTIYETSSSKGPRHICHLLIFFIILKHHFEHMGMPFVTFLRQHNRRDAFKSLHVLPFYVLVFRHLVWLDKGSCPV